MFRAGASTHPPPMPITTQVQLGDAVVGMVTAVNNAIKATIPKTKPSRFAKRWWNRDLDDMRKVKNRLSREAYRHRGNTDHGAHQALREYRNKYSEAITEAKETHWTNFLEEADESALWTAGRYITNPNGEGAACPRIPTLHTINPDGSIRLHKTNAEKADLLAKTFFPPPPLDHGVPPDSDYPPPLPYHAEFSRAHICRTASRLQPHKAPGPDKIPNVIWKESIDILIEYLFHIFNVVMRRGFFHEPWLEQLICVLRKPDKDSYNIAKAHRPIALLKTLYKMFASMLTDITTAFAEQYSLLPEHHFGGRHGRRTTDSMHLIVHRIKQAWRWKKVAQTRSRSGSSTICRRVGSPR